MLASDRLEQARAERLRTLRLWVFEAVVNAAFWMFLFWIALK